MPRYARRSALNPIYWLIGTLGFLLGCAIAIGIVALVRTTLPDEPHFSDVPFTPNSTIVDTSTVQDESRISEGLVDLSIKLGFVNNITKGNVYHVGSIPMKYAHDDLILNLCGTGSLTTTAFFVLNTTGELLISPLDTDIVV